MDFFSVKLRGFRRVIAALLAVFLVITQFPISTYADEEIGETVSISYDYDENTTIIAERDGEIPFSEGDYLIVEEEKDFPFELPDGDYSKEDITAYVIFSPTIYHSSGDAEEYADTRYSVVLKEASLVQKIRDGELIPVIYSITDDQSVIPVEEEKLSIEFTAENYCTIEIKTSVDSFCVALAEKPEEADDENTSEEDSESVDSNAADKATGTDAASSAIATDTDAAAAASDTDADMASDTDASATISKEDTFESIAPTPKFKLGGTRNIKKLGATPSAGYADYTGFLTKHEIVIDGKIMKGDGTETIDPSKEFGVNLEFNLKFDDMTANGVKFYYQLPEHISIGDKGSVDNQLTLYDGSGTAIGTYYIKDDIIYVTYPGYYEDCTTRFNLSASWDGVANSSEVQVDWKDKIDTFKIDNTNIMAEKSAVKYTAVTDPNSNYLYTTEFKVTARAKEKVGANGLSDIQLTDTMSGTKMVFMEDQYDDGTGTMHDFKVVWYDADDQELRSSYYDIGTGATLTATPDGDKTTTVFTIDGLDINQGEHLTVFYKAGITKDKSSIVMAEGDSYTNRGDFSYDYINPDTGAKERHTVSATDTGNKGKDAQWLHKSTPSKNEMSFITVGEDMKTIAKYKVTINSGLTENVGGSSINDKISMPAGDAAKGYKIGYYSYDPTMGTDYKYNKNNYFVPKYTYTDASGNSVEKQITFLVLSQALYNRVKAYHASDSGLQMDKFLADTSLISEINTAKGISLTADNVSDYIFTYEDAAEFVWFAPKSTDNRSYELSYYSCADASVSSYTNGASFWFKTMFSNEPGDATPTVIRFATSKYNDGEVIVTENGWFVDYTINFTMGENSAPLYDWNISDWFPSYNLTFGQNDVKVYDWLDGLNENSLSMTDTDGTANAAALQNCFTITTDSNRDDVKDLVNNITVGYQKIEWISLKNQPYNDQRGKELNKLLASEASKPESILYSNNHHNENSMIYKAGDAAAMAGQFVANADVAENNNGLKNNAISQNDRYSIGGVIFFVGDLPDTMGKDPYTITIKYRMRVNPYLVDNLQAQLKEENKTELTLKNTAKWFGEYSYNDRNLHSDAVGTGRSASLPSHYTIGADIPADTINKTLTKGYDSADNSMTYKIDVNSKKELVAVEQKYKVHDNLGMMGVKYMPGTIEVKDEDGKIVYTEISGHTVDSSYTGLATYTKTDSDTESNSFDLVLDNETGKFTDANGKLKAFTISYKLDVTEVVDSTSQLTNSATLSVWEPESSDVPAHWKDLGAADTSNSIAKALDKALVKAPSADNDFKAEYKIKVDPQSPNSKELKTIADQASVATPQTFTLQDTFDDTLTLDLDSVKIEQVVGGTSTDITNKCSKAYDSRNRIFTAEIVMTDPAATYLITYKALTTGVEMNKMATLSNTAKIVGTTVAEEETNDQVYIYKYAGAASATALKIKLCKYDEADIDKKLENVTFDLYQYGYTNADPLDENGINTKKATAVDGTWGQVPVASPITTDSNGEFVLQNQTVSQTEYRQVEYDTWYKLVETDAPTGYVAAAPYYYYVYGDGRNKDMVPADADGKYAIVIPAKDVNDEVPVIYVGNGKLQLTILKVDSVNKDALSGAEFGLYSDQACTDTNLIAQGTTGTDGKIIFNNLSISYPTDIYLKEITAPNDYVANNNIYRVHLDDRGQITEVVNSRNSIDTLEFDADLAKITITNDLNYAYLSVSKKVMTQAVRSTASFSFVINLKDSNGDAITQAYAANKILSDGTVQAYGNYRSGTVITLKHGEKFEIPKIDQDITYTVTEVEDKQYSATYSSVKKVGNTSTEVTGEGNVVNGDVAKGERSEVTFENTRKLSLIIKKEVEREDGGEISIPVGHTITVRSNWDGGVEYASARWNGTKYVSTSVNDALGVVFSNTDESGAEITQGFRLLNLPVNASIYLIESNVTVDGYVCELVNHDGYNSYGRWMANTYSGLDRVDTLKNIYSKGEAEASLVVKKELIGKDLEKDEFGFTLRYKRDGNYNAILQQKTNVTNGNVSFDTIQYTLDDLKEDDGQGNVTELDSKDFYYMIEENLTNTQSHVTYDSKKVYAKVTVSRVKDLGGVTTGLTADAPVYYDMDPKDPNAQEISGDELTFTNAYSAKGDITFKASKTVTGRNAYSKEFGFSIVEYTDNTFSTPISGTSSVGSATNGDITKDSTGEVTFNTLTYELTSDRVNKITNRNDVVKEHYYIIKENIPEQAASNGNKLSGWTYDDTEYKVIVNVTDDGKGNLVAKAYDENGKEISSESFADEFNFTNTYESSGKINLQVAKEITGRTFTDSDDFTFKADEVLPDGTKPLNEWDVIKSDVTTGTTNPSDGDYYTAITFDDIKYTQEDAGKTYFYRISEVIPDDAKDGTYKGVTYSDVCYLAVVYLSDFGGTIYPNVTYYTSDFNLLTYPDTGYYDGVSPYLLPIYTNDYHAHGEAVFELSKELLGRDLAEDDSFTFTVDRIDADGVVQEKNVATGSMNDFAGKSVSDIKFTSIEYDESDVGNTYYYRITENIPDDASENSLNGVTYTTKPVIATVKVSDAGDGTLITDITYNEESIFTNMYSAYGGITIKADKILNRMDLKEGQFSFGLYEDGTLLQTVTNDADGAVRFDIIKYDLNDVGTKAYVVKEIIPDDSEIKDGAFAYTYGDESGWMTYDSSEYTVKVDIEDTGKGMLKVTASGATRDEEDGLYKVDYDNSVKAAAFENTFSKRTPVEVTFAGKKTLENNNLRATGPISLDGLFKFSINEVISGKLVKVGSGVSDKNGNIIYDTLTYDWEDIGTHEYMITEDNNSVAGVIYDTSSINVIVNVIDNGDGTMSTKVSYSEAGKTQTDASFENKTTETKFEKVDEGGNYLEKAVIRIEETDGTMVKQYISSGEVDTVYGLEYGKTYVMREMQAPNGYDVADAITFQIGQDGKLYVDGAQVDTIKMVDKKTAIGTDKKTTTGTDEKTGDSARLNLMLTLLILCGVGIVLIGLFKRKTRTK